MSLFLANLDDRTRALMLEEVDYDTARQQLHISPTLSGQGQHDYENLLRQAIASGDETTLAARLSEHRRIARTAHRRKPEGGYAIVTVPHNAAGTIAESEFNRYYIRALCRRAKPVREARPESEELVESTVNAQALLEDLREHTGDTPPAMGIPGGPNSGISVRLP